MRILASSGVCCFVFTYGKSSENKRCKGGNQHVVWGKTTRCLKKNDTLFERKRYVVCEKTTRWLRENDTLFMRKRHVVWEKTTRWLRENDTLFERKRHVVYEKTTRRLKWKEESEKERKILRRWFRMRRRVKVGILKIHHFHRKCDSNKC